MTDAVRVSMSDGELYFDTHTEDDVRAIWEYMKMVDRPLNLIENVDGSCVVSGDESSLFLLLSNFVKVEIQL